MHRRSLLTVVSCAFAVALAAPARADLNYTLYGRLDAFVEYDAGGSQGSRVSFESGGIYGSRLGVKGDLPLDSASEWKGLYQLEAGFFIDNAKLAQGGRVFGRQAYAGVSSPYGSLTFGRQYTMINNIAGDFDAFEIGYGSPTNDGQFTLGADTRYDKSIIYWSPKLGGFHAEGMIAFGGQTGRTGKNMLGVRAGYAEGPVAIDFAYQYDDHNLIAAGTLSNAVGAASVKIGPALISGGVGGVWATPDAGAETTRYQGFVGAKIDVISSGQLWLDYGIGKTKDSAPSDMSAAYSAAWVQTVVERFKVYLIYSIHTNDPGSALVPVGTNSSTSYTVSPGDTARGLAVGAIYWF